VSKKIFVVSLALCLMLIPVFSGITLAAPPHKDDPGGVSTVPTPQGEVEIYKKSPPRGDWPKMTITPKGPKPHAAQGKLGEILPEVGKRYAILVGISDYPGDYGWKPGCPGDGLDLWYAADDAYLMAEILETTYGFEIYGGTPLKNQAATRDAILTAIEEIKDEVEDDDEVVFYFSGHGAKLTSANKGQIGILTWGVETSEISYPEFISDKDLKTWFEGFETDRIIFIFDCCLAGGMIDIGREGNVICMASTQNGFAIEYGEDYKNCFDPPAEPIPGIGWVNHGLFTYLFAGYGIKYGVADVYDHNEDGIIGQVEDVTIEEAFDFTRLIMEGISNSSPELWLIPTIGDRFKNDLLP